MWWDWIANHFWARLLNSDILWISKCNAQVLHGTRMSRQDPQLCKAMVGRTAGFLGWPGVWWQQSPLCDWFSLTYFFANIWKVVWWYKGWYNGGNNGGIIGIWWDYNGNIGRRAGKYLTWKILKAHRNPRFYSWTKLKVLVQPQ